MPMEKSAFMSKEDKHEKIIFYYSGFVYGSKQRHTAKSRNNHI